MTTETINQRLRLFLFALAGFVFIGTVIELAFAEHTETPLQFIPFILCGLGLLTVSIVLLFTSRKTIRFLRVVMGFIIAGSLFGMFEHIQNNLAFALEIRPNAVPSEVVFEALSGASPLLAPGILALGALLALTATYYHPALRPVAEEE